MTTTVTEVAYPARLIREARRVARRLEFASYGQAVAAGTAAAKWWDGRTNWLLIVGAVAAFAAIPVTMTLRRRQLQRAAWLHSTDRWWERLEEMPRMEPFPKVVDFVEERVVAGPKRLLAGWRRR
jgi:hypothetical protein